MLLLPAQLVPQSVVGRRTTLDRFETRMLRDVVFACSQFVRMKLGVFAFLSRHVGRVTR